MPPVPRLSRHVDGPLNQHRQHLRRGSDEAGVPFLVRLIARRPANALAALAEDFMRLARTLILTDRPRSRCVHVYLHPASAATFVTVKSRNGVTPRGVRCRGSAAR